MLESHYPSAREDVQEAISQLNGRKVTDVKAKSERCLESYPCKGHGGAVLTFSDGSSTTISCTSVSIGAIEVYFFPDRMLDSYTGSKHFIEYITKNFAAELGKGVHG